MLLITSNRGLAGAFNSNLIKEARALVARLEGAGVTVDLHVVGTKGVGYFKYVGRALASHAHRHRRQADHRATPPTSWTRLRADFGDGKLDAVHVVYTQVQFGALHPPR